MKKHISWMLAAVVLFAVLPGGIVSLAGEQNDVSVRTIVPRGIGNAADIVCINGWIICNGYLESSESYALKGYPPTGGDPINLGKMPNVQLVPAGDAFIYLQPSDKGNPDWVLYTPGEEPKKLPLSVMDHVFYADETHIWYTTVGTGDGTNKSIRTLERKTNQKEGLARLESIQIWVVAVLDDGGILLYDRDNNLVRRWQNGKLETLLETEEQILGVFSTGQQIWVQLEHEIGLLENGTLWFRIPGTVTHMAQALGQTALLLSFPGSNEYDVLVLNDTYRAYTRIDYAPFAERMLIEITPNGQLIIRIPDDELHPLFEMPPDDAWIPYGFYEVELAVDPA